MSGPDTIIHIQSDVSQKKKIAQSFPIRMIVIKIEIKDIIGFIWLYISCDFWFK